MARPARLRAVSPTGVSWFDTGTYQYDEAGHIWAIGADQYTYDSAGRLMTATVTHAGPDRGQNYTYDSFDNLLSVAQDGNAANVYRVNANTNRLEGTFGQPQDIFFDLAGNMTRIGTTSQGTPAYEQTYDALNMAATFIHRDPGGTLVSEYNYLYGPGNRRLMTYDPHTSERVVTLRDLDGSPLREFSVTGWGVNADWKYTHDYIRGAAGIFGRRAANGYRRYLHRDYLGSLRLISSGAPTNAIETGEHHFYPFGASAFNSGNDPLKAKYTGHGRDSHKASDYVMRRTCVFPYERFMSVDPGRDGWNLYAYVGNNPVGFVDPDGHERV
ncbi:MAG: RHS repeat-associated core domain-containing protein [Acidobacteriota bacterium]